MTPDTNAPSSPLPGAPAADSDPDTDYARWRAERLRDEDYAAWRQTGAKAFPPDFDSWRRARRELIAEQSAAGLPLLPAGEDAPASDKAGLLFERS